jgi:hypothetical protein
MDYQYKFIPIIGELAAGWIASTALSFSFLHPKLNLMAYTRKHRVGMPAFWHSTLYHQNPEQLSTVP